MKRWLFNLAAGMSLVLCMAAAALLVDGWLGNQRLWKTGTSRNGGGFAHADGTVLAYYGDLTTLNQGTISFHSIPGARFRHADGPGKSDALWVSDWLILTLAAPLPLAWALTKVISRQRDRRIRGLCANCGYDLRATPDRCPECGTIPSKLTEAAK